jgi:glycerophosphoryl diester phosphodiesterase
VARLPSLLDPPIGFAHRGARAHAPENTIEAFELALELGATGLETDAWLTADGVVVLDHDGVVRSGLRRRPIAEIDHAHLPRHIPALTDLYEAVGTAIPLSIDVKDPAAAAPILDTARAAGADPATLYLCSPSWEEAASWHDLDPEVRVVHSARLRQLKGAPERHAARLAEAGVDTINMPYPDWTGGLTTLFHRFGLWCFAWDAQHPRQLHHLLDMGADAVYSDHVDRLADALRAVTKG